MNPAISGDGKSFQGLCDYLAHDPEKAKTAERVAWTHTLNCANDFVPAAVNEMYLIAENAELLKQEAGIRAGGRPLEKPVKHISLNWAPEDKPSREHMIETSERYLRHMGWHEHQAILIAHDDKKYRHVHIMLNKVHPETGLCLNDGNEQHRSQAWALQYELGQNRVHCTERLKNAEERERNMPRNIWMEFKPHEKEFEHHEKILAEKSPKSREFPESRENSEWKILKEFQQEERIEFFAQGKLEFKELRSSIFREVKDEFRKRWSNFYKMRENGADAESLAAAKAQLVADQNAALEPRRDTACKALRESRDERYEHLLDHQKEIRSELHRRQELGLDNASFLDGLEERRQAGHEIRQGFREAVGEVSGTKQGHVAEEDRRSSDTPASGGSRRAEFDPSRRVAGFFSSFIGNLFTDLTNLGSARPEPISAEERETVFREAAESALKQQQQRERNEEDERWRARQKSDYGE